MDSAAGPVKHVIRGVRGLATPLLVGVVALATVAIIVVALVAGLLQPASEMVLVAPFRWWS